MQIEVPAYDGNTICMKWENSFEIKCTAEGSAVVLSANQAWACFFGAAFAHVGAGWRSRTYAYPSGCRQRACMRLVEIDSDKRISPCAQNERKAAYI